MDLGRRTPLAVLQLSRKPLSDRMCILARSKVLPFYPSTSNVYACNDRSVNCYEDDKMHWNLSLPQIV